MTLKQLISFFNGKNNNGGKLRKQKALSSKTEYTMPEIKFNCEMIHQKTGSVNLKTKEQKNIQIE